MVTTFDIKFMKFENQLILMCAQWFTKCLIKNVCILILTSTDSCFDFVVQVKTCLTIHYYLYTNKPHLRVKNNRKSLIKKVIKKNKYLNVEINFNFKNVNKVYVFQNNSIHVGASF